MLELLREKKMKPGKTWLAEENPGHSKIMAMMTNAN